MFEKARKNWEEFKNSEPGHRFRERYERRQKESKGWLDPGKIINIVVGLVIVALGLILIPVPGPGSLVTLLGLGLIGCEFAPMARFLDWLEVRVRAVHEFVMNLWKTAPLPLKVVYSLGIAAMTCIVGYGVYQFFFQPIST